MSLFAYNLTGSPVILAAGSPIVTLPASAAPPARGKAYNVTAEIRPNLTVDPVNGKTGGLAASAYLLLQAQVTNGQVWYEWTSEPEYLTPGLTVSTPGDEDPNLVKQTIAELHVYADGVLGLDTNDGLQKSAGTGGSFAVLAGVVTFTVSSGTPFLPTDVGKLITINYATSSANCGGFRIDTVPANNQVTYANPLGVTEAMPVGVPNVSDGKWAVSSPKLTLQAVYDLVPYYVNHNVCVHLSGTFSEIGNVFLDKWIAADKLLVIDGGSGLVPVTAFTGVGGTFSKTGSIITFTASGTPNFTAALIGKNIHVGLLGTVAGNTGNWTILGGANAPTPTTLQWTNAAGVAGAYTGTWYIQPFNKVITGTGDSLTFTAGPNTVDLIDTGAAFTADDLGKQITIAGSGAGNDGTFVITVVVSATQVTYVNAGGATEALFPGTWTLGGWVSDLANSGTSSSIGFAGAGWAVDQFVGCYVEIMAAPSAPATVGQTRSISSNTATAIIPMRNFSVAPGATALFRIVRPKTTIQATTTASNLMFVHKGGSRLGLPTFPSDTGVLSFQRCTLAGSNLELNSGDCNGQRLSGLFVTTIRPSQCLFLHEIRSISLTGGKYNPHTFVYETAATDSCVGVSVFCRTASGGSVYIRMCNLVSLSNAYSLLYNVNKTSTLSMTEGSRCAALFMFGCPLDVWNLVFITSSSSGYATTKISGSPNRNVGFYVRDGSVGIGTIDLTSLNDYGIEVMHGFLQIRGVTTGVTAKAGLYVHSNSTVHVLGGVTPALSGTLLGNITVDGATLATTWAAIAGGTPFTSTEELVRIKAYTSPVG